MALKGNPTILVVDDEELIREVASMMIEEEGGAVLLAKNGKEAVDVYREHQSKIKCVFMDFSMPEMNGYEAYLEIMQINPKVGIVMASGLKIISEVEKLKNGGKIQFLSKPFQQSDVIRAINAAMGQG